MSYQDSKVNWEAPDGVTHNDFNRIEGNISDLYEDSRVELFDDEVELFYDVEPLDSEKMDQMLLWLEGNTKINLLGYAGNGDALTHYVVSGGTATVDTTQTAIPSGSLKLTSGGTNSYINFNILSMLDRTKYYCFSAYVKNYNLASGLAISYTSDGMTPVEVATSRVTDTGYFRRIFLKIDASRISAGATYAYLRAIATGTSGQYGWVDCLMLEEISSTDYNDASYQPSPYIHGAWSPGDTPVQIRAVGKNLYLTCEGGANDYASNSYGYNDRLTHKYCTIPVEPNHTYTISTDNPTLTLTFREFDSSKILQNAGANIIINGEYQFTTGANTHYVNFVFYNGGSAIRPEDVQIQVEDSFYATAYEPYHETIVEINQPLRALPLDIKDTIDYDGVLTKRVGYLQTDLTTEVAVNSKGTYVTRIRLPIPETFFNTSSGSSSNFLIKYNGKKLVDRGILTFTAGLNTEGISFWSDGYAYWDTLNSETGWGAAYTPTKMEMQAFLAGWQMYDISNNTSPYNRTDNNYKGWRYIYGNINGQGVIPTYTTSGWIYNRLMYRLTTPTRTFIAVPMLKTEIGDRIVVDSNYQYFTRPKIKYIKASNLKANLDAMMKSLSRLNRTVNQLLTGSAPFAPIGYGLGQDLVGVQVSDSNNAIKTGMYYAGNSDPNKPISTVQDGALLVLAYSANWINQMYFDWRTNKTYRRTRNNGTWSAWTTLPMSQKVSASSFQDAQMPAGFYTNAGDGLPNADGVGSFISNWWHVLTSHHYDENGYGAQLALPFYGTYEGKSGAPWFRSANGSTWTTWKRLAHMYTTSVTLLNGWTFWSGWGRTYLHKVGNLVTIDLMVSNPTTSTSQIFQLPTGWLPNGNGCIAAVANGSNVHTQVWVESNGNVHIGGVLPANAQWVAIKASFECAD